MESAKQQPLLELWLQDVQSYIYRVTSGSMGMARFQFNRPSLVIKGKQKSQDELSIIFRVSFRKIQDWISTRNLALRNQEGKRIFYAGYCSEAI
jgi:hypothetical protein